MILLEPNSKQIMGVKEWCQQVIKPEENERFLRNGKSFIDENELNTALQSNQHTTKEEIRQIVDLMLKDLFKRLAEKELNIEVSDEHALLNEFTCPECGEVYSLKDSIEGIKEIEKIVQKLMDRSAQILVEIEKLNVERAPKPVKKEKIKKTKAASKSKVKSKSVKKEKKIAKKPIKKRKKK